MGPPGSSLAQLHRAQALGLDFAFAPAQWIDNVRDLFYRRCYFVSYR